MSPLETAAAFGVVLWIGLVVYLAHLAAQGIAADWRDQKRRLEALRRRGQP